MDVVLHETYNQRRITDEVDLQSASSADILSKRAAHLTVSEIWYNSGSWGSEVESNFMPAQRQPSKRRAVRKQEWEAFSLAPAAPSFVCRLARRVHLAQRALYSSHSNALGV